MAWRKEVPSKEGWYWVSYRGGHGGLVKCPAYVTFVKKTTVIVQTARNDTFTKGPNHGGGQNFVCRGEVDKSLRFGPEIPEPS